MQLEIATQVYDCIQINYTYCRPSKTGTGDKMAAACRAPRGLGIVLRH